jgi:acyl-CoA reductase-like NAD-dependent aldehyde dehydrogenase
MSQQRVPVLKTYKLYIGGEFPRTESGRTYVLADGKGRPLANICQASRKDFREAVVKARAAVKGWASRSGYNRGQILYRLAELVEGRREQFIAELRQQGSNASDARREVDDTIDCLIYYAGWSDKYQQLFSTVNPVASPHFSFSMPEATGVVSLIAAEDSGLHKLVARICPIIVGGNCVIALASEKKPLTAITFAEVCAAGDVPPGVINILTGLRSELASQMASHMDVNAIVYDGDNPADQKVIQEQSSLNLKRVIFPESSRPGPYHIADTQEVKTTWHPVGY